MNYRYTWLLVVGIQMSCLAMSDQKKVLHEAYDRLNKTPYFENVITIKTWLTKDVAISSGLGWKSQNNDNGPVAVYVDNKLTLTPDIAQYIIAHSAIEHIFNNPTKYPGKIELELQGKYDGSVAEIKNNKVNYAYYNKWNRRFFILASSLTVLNSHLYFKEISTSFLFVGFGIIVSILAGSWCYLQQKVAQEAAQKAFFQKDRYIIDQTLTIFAPPRCFERYRFYGGTEEQKEWAKIVRTCYQEEYNILTQSYTSIADDVIDMKRLCDYKVYYLDKLFNSYLRD